MPHDAGMAPIPNTGRKIPSPPGFDQRHIPHHEFKAVLLKHRGAFSESLWGQCEPSIVRILVSY